MTDSKASAPDVYYNEPPPPYSATPYPPGFAAPGFGPTAGPPPSAAQGYGATYPTSGPATPGRTTTVVLANPRFGAYPTTLTCPKCNKNVVTKTYASPGLLTFILSGVLCVVGLFCGCCLLPFCIKECQNIEHHCPNCKSFLGRYQRI